MTNKSKSFAIILSTLLIGIIIGVLATGTFRNQRERRFDRLPPQERFESFVQDVIAPTSEQKQQYEVKMEKWSAELAGIHRKHQNELVAIYDSLRADLSSILSEEQKSRLEHHLARGGRRLINTRLAGLAEALELTNEQQEKLTQILGPLRDEFRRPRGERPPDWEARRKMMHDKMEQIEHEIVAILTPEQRDKFQELKYQLPPPFHRPFRGPGGRGRRPFPRLDGRPQ